MDNLSIDVSQLKRLATDLRRAGPALAKTFLAQLGHAGDVVALAARDKASFSTRIPGSIKVRRRGVTTQIVAGGDAAPDAAPFEHGGLPGTFRHPVFGNRDVWVSQKAHPFLAPAVEEHIAEVTAFTLIAVDEAMATAGFR